MRRQEGNLYIFCVCFFVFYFVFFAGGFGFERAGGSRLVCAPGGETQWQAARQPEKSGRPHASRAGEKSEQSADGAPESERHTGVCLLRVLSSTSGLEITQ